MNSENDDNLYPLKQTASFRIPPKPSRVPSFRKPVIRHSEVGRTSSPKSNPRNTSNLRFEGRNSPIAEKHAISDIPSDLLNQQALTYTSNILQPNNKPLDASAMAASKKLLLHTDPFKIAKHITYHDYKVCQINTKGLERMFFPVGRNLRKQIIERYQCMAFWVAITVLSGGSDIDEMVDILNVYIQVANELVHSLGNVFGFSALMHGLFSPQLVKVKKLWTSLQQRYTNNSVTLFKKLNPLLRLLDEGRGKINIESTCIPHIIPIIRFLENPLLEIPHSSNRTSNPNTGNNSSGGDEMEQEWWKNIPDDSFDGMLAQLNVARPLIRSQHIFQKNSQAKLFTHENEMGKVLHELLSTPFHLRLLFGQKAVESPQWERYAKFDRLTTLVAKRNITEDD